MQALAEVVGGLTRDFPLPVLIVQHLSPTRKSRIAEVIGRLTALPVLDAIQGEALLPGRIYFAPPDEHLQVKAGHVLLSHAEPVHYLRPNVDTLFRSVAAEFGRRAIAVILSGSLNDGAEGIRLIKEAGGTTIAELPDDAEFRSMPEAAIATGLVDFVVPIVDVAPLLNRLCAEAATAQ